MFVTEVVSLIEGEWSCYRCDHFNGGKMVTLQRWSVYWKENVHVTEVVTLMEGGLLLQVATLMEGEWSLQR